jgi:hypothetical protein
MVSQAHQVVQGTRASHRLRRETKQRIIQARREGRIPQDVCDARMQSACQAVTTADLRHLESDLGEREGTHPQHIMWVVCCVPTLIAVWEPVFLSGLAWLALAVPVTVGVPFLAWVLPGLLP